MCGGYDNFRLTGGTDGPCGVQQEGKSTLTVLHVVNRGIVTRCPDRICSECHGKGHDAPKCSIGWRGNNWRSHARGGGYSRRDYVKNLGTNNQVEERATSITVKVGDSSIRALLDTGAKVNVMDLRTLEKLELTNFLRTDDTGLVYGVGGTPITVVGSVETPIRIPGAEPAGLKYTFYKAKNRRCY